MASSTVPEPDYSYLGLILSTGDPRTRDWPMMGSPVIVVSILASYLYFCTSLGPRLMKNREAFNIRPIVLAYNVIMVGLSLFFCVLTLKLTYVGQEIGPYNVVCEATSTTDSVLLYWGWWYMLTKIGELLDTVFFVFLKKNSHISFLHLLHHSLALGTVWMDINNGITGQVAMFPILNAAVHVVMYGYYGLAALPSSVKPNLWWKKYVTQFQIAQFFALMVHGLMPFIFDCGFPKTMASLMVLEAGLFTCLFSDFYYKNYIKGQDERYIIGSSTKSD
ncbi:elongation of very long chain fatty acids protein AAEL008004-like isoform X1 [Varroa jacobsoni]|uniref:Elongation of very long chain fatty acids protein n=1 Tax=Varroa destructor TaxID=109461 RepID=A0A7M7JI70_VARDE|nr:elongation of very long chain fatty acids protein AAEL008004-like isoform X1 [Varroa destructor]XP_022699287.1 elongation of very long chain fatty acids protein AAEL008004-like isoform X1 [Varroa jacobsoni]